MKKLLCLYIFASHPTRGGWIEIPSIGRRAWSQTGLTPHGGGRFEIGCIYTSLSVLWFTPYGRGNISAVNGEYVVSHSGRSRYLYFIHVSIYIKVCVKDYFDIWLSAFYNLKLVGVL